MEDKFNIFINSKYKQKHETNYNFNVLVPNAFIKKDVDKNDNDQYFVLTISSFAMYYNFYQCNSNYNYFQLIFRNAAGFMYLTFDYYLNTGNPTVTEIQQDINNQLSNYLTVTYDKIKNIFKFQRIYPQDANTYNMYIKPINSSNFFGLNNNTEYLIPSTNYLNSIYPININSISSILINLSGDISYERDNIDNTTGNGIFNASDIIFMKSIDVARNGIIKYENQDNNTSFIYKLSNINNIKYLTLKIFDQNMNFITDLPEFSMTLQIILMNKEKTDDLLIQLIDYTKNIFLLLSFIYEKILNFKKYLSK